jgi:alpha-mannosidase
MRLSLLRAPISPDPLADRGRHAFTYSLLPHIGDLRDSQVIDQAYSLNVPLIIRDLTPAAGTLPASHSFFLGSRPGVVFETIKIAEAGAAIVLRLYEAEGGRGPLEVTTTLPVRKARLTNLLETDEKPLPLSNGVVHLDLKPFEIATLKFAL